MYMMPQRLASNLSRIVVTHVREEEWVMSSVVLRAWYLYAMKSLAASSYIINLNTIAHKSPWCL